MPCQPLTLLERERFVPGSIVGGRWPRGVVPASSKMMALTGRPAPRVRCQASQVLGIHPSGGSRQPAVSGQEGADALPPASAPPPQVDGGREGIPVVHRATSLQPPAAATDVLASRIHLLTVFYEDDPQLGRVVVLADHQRVGVIEGAGDGDRAASVGGGGVQHHHRG